MERMREMDISAVTPTNQAMGISAINMRSMASIQVMDLAQNAFEDAAAQLIATMNAMTGVGHSIDTYA